MSDPAGVPGLAGVRGGSRARRRDRAHRGTRRIAPHAPTGARRHQSCLERAPSPHLEARSLQFRAPYSYHNCCTTNENIFELHF